MNARVRAANLDEPEPGTGPGCQVTPLRPGGLDGVDGIHDDVVTESDLLRGQRLDDDIGGQAGRL